MTAANAAVPSGVVAEGANRLSRRLPGRDTLLLWDGDGASPPHPPWVVVQITGRAFTWQSEAAEDRRVAPLERTALERTAHKIAHKRDGYVVLDNVGGGSAVVSRAAG